MKWKYIIPVLLLLIQFSCTEIIDPSISGSTVQLYAPADSLNACSGIQTFWWSEVEFADSFELQVVSPDFQHIDRLILDTTIKNNQFGLTLAPGTYQWRVSAMNSNDNTPYSTRTLTVENMQGFTDVLLFHISPGDSSYLNNVEQNFSWGTDKRIKQYDFTLYYQNQVVDNEKLTDDSIHEKLIWGDGNYRWSVQGISCDTTTSISWSGFILDTKKPEPPVLQNPENAAELTNSTVLFKWASDNGKSGAKCFDSLFIYTDSTLDAVQLKEQATSMSSQVTLRSGKKYYWRVRTWDKAGNVSDYSKTRVFKITHP